MGILRNIHRALGFLFAKDISAAISAFKGSKMTESYLLSALGTDLGLSEARNNTVFLLGSQESLGCFSEDKRVCQAVFNLRAYFLGDSEAAFALANLFYSGSDHFPRDSEAARYFFKSCEAKEPSCRFSLARMEFSGLGGKKDEGRA